MCIHIFHLQNTITFTHADSHVFLCMRVYTRLLTNASANSISWPPFPDFTHSLTDSWFLSFIKSNTICNDRRGFEWKQNKPRPTSLRQGVGFPVYLHPIFDIFLSPLLSCLLYYASKQNGASGERWREVDNTQVFITIICLFLTSHFSPSECAKHKTEILRPFLSFYVTLQPHLNLCSCLDFFALGWI